MLILPHRAFRPPAGLLAREALRGRGLELYVPDHRIRLPGVDRRPGLRRAISVTNLTNTGASHSTTCALTTGVAIPAGSLIFIVVTDSASTLGMVTDSAGNSYTAVNSGVLLDNISTDGIVGLFYCPNCLALTSSNTITYTTHSGTSAIETSAAYATGVATTSPLDTAVTATNFGSSATASVTSGRPSVGGELLVAAVGAKGGVLSYSGYSSGWTGMSVAETTTAGTAGGEWFVQTTAAAVTPSLTISSSAPWGAIVVGFQPADVLMPQILM